MCNCFVLRFEIAETRRDGPVDTNTFGIYYVTLQICGFARRAWLKLTEDTLLISKATRVNNYEACAIWRSRE
jgi:hypothetical protein